MIQRITQMMLLILATGAIITSDTFGAKPAKKQAPPRELAVELGAPFCDNMILQREMDVPVWGWSKPGTKVTVEFKGQKVTAVAGKDGKWMLKLKPLKASAEPAEMVISDSNGSREVLKNVLVGEVWMASGQSNMQWEAGNCIVGRKLIPEIKARVEAGKEKMPIIREAKVTNKFSSLYPSTRGVKGRWSDDWNDFSAIAFAFAYDIAKELQVPVGIVNCAFSTTKIQAWIPREGFASGKDEYTKAIYQQILETDVNTPEHKAAWDQFEKEILAWGAESKARVEKGLKPKDKPGVPGNMHGNRDATWMCNGKMMPMAPYAIRGAIWNQGYASQNEGIVYRNNLHSLVRGWRTVFNNPDLPVYFHQFYGGGNDGITLNARGEMRMGTWLAHRDIPNAAMASQVDITGGVHYYNKAVPGQRLARHALKNQYGKKIIANGPMYKGYNVKGKKLILELEHAKGLCAGQNMTVRGGYADAVVVEDGEDQVKLFYIADKDMIWHQATMKIKGETIELTAPDCKTPCGVAYGCNGVGGQVGVYNEAMLPLTPFVLYEHKLVLSDQWDLDHIRIPGADDPELMTWPKEYMPVAGKVIDPVTYGLRAKYYKLWLLAPQFAHNCVIQADVPTRLYGKALPKSVVTVKFADFEKSITMGDEQDEWEMTVPAMKASAEPKLLHVTCTLDGKLAHERKISNVVVGDVWYVAAGDLKIQRGPGVPKSGPAPVEAWEGRNPQLRMLTSGGRRAESMPTRFKMNASGNPRSRFFTRWAPTIGLTKELAERIHAKTGKPVGIIALDPGGGAIKDWTGYEYLAKVKAWKSDYDQLYSRYAPDPDAYVNNARQYIKNWKDYWKSVKSDPDFETGAMARFPGSTKVETKATTIYNQSICGLSPGNFKAILCLTGKGFVDEDEGAGFGEQFSVMANCWKDAFARGKEVIDPYLIYAIPSKALAPEVTRPKDIEGKSAAFEISEWFKIGSKRAGKETEITLSDNLVKLIDFAVNKVYK